MAYQTGRQIEVVYKPEAAFGALPPPQGAKVFRANSGGLTLAIEPIRSNENRRDGMTTRGRHGSRSVTGQYAGDISVGTYDDLIEAALRGSFAPALAVNAAAMNGASVSVSANAITASAGSWINAGLRVGDVITLGAGFVGTNQNRNLRIIGLTATVITVAETLTPEARGRLQPLPSTVPRRSFRTACHARLQSRSVSLILTARKSSRGSASGPCRSTCSRTAWQR